MGWLRKWEPIFGGSQNEEMTLRVRPNAFELALLASAGAEFSRRSDAKTDTVRIARSGQRVGRRSAHNTRANAPALDLARTGVHYPARS